MSVHRPLRQHTKRVNLSVISEELTQASDSQQHIIEEDLEREALDREEDRRTMIINGYDPDTPGRYTNQEEYESAVDKLGYVSGEERAVINDVLGKLPSRYMPPDVDFIDYCDYGDIDFEDGHGPSCYLN